MSWKNRMLGRLDRAGDDDRRALEYREGDAPEHILGRRSVRDLGRAKFANGKPDG